MKFIKYWLPPILWATAIFTVSSITVGSSSDFYWKDFVVKKTAHVVEYGILATLIYRALINSNVSNKKAMLYSVILAFLYGATDEFHQSFTPGRGPKFTDVLIDTFGATLFIYGIVANIKKMPENIKQFFSKIQITI